MFRSIYWYAKFIFSLVFERGNLKKARMLEEKGDDKEFDDFVFDITTKWAENRIKDSGAEIVVHNEERIPKDRNVLFVSNHQSNFDILILMSKIKKDTGFVAKIELGKIPLLRDWMKNIHCVFMDRGDLKQSMQTIIEGISLLKKGKSLVIFPEGTRSKGDKMGEFKAGSFKLALKSKVPIVPISLNGSYKIMEGNNNIIKPAHVDVYIHEPIYTENLTKEEIANLHETVRATIASKVDNN